MRDLGNYLYSKGFTVFCPRFSRFDLKERPASWESWVNLADSAYSTMTDYSKQNLVVGLSLGGTVAIILARNNKIPALVLLAPAVAPRLGVKDRLSELARRVVPSFVHRATDWNGEVMKAMEHIRETTEEISSPTLVLQARDDRVLATKGLKLLRKWVTHADSEVVLLPSGAHALTRSKTKEEVFERVFKFAEHVGVISGSD